MEFQTSAGPLCVSAHEQLLGFSKITQASQDAAEFIKRL